MNPATFREHLDKAMLLLEQHRQLRTSESLDLFVEHIVKREEPFTAHQFFVLLNSMSPFWNHEEKKHASNSFLRRKIAEGSILFNGERMEPDELMDFPLFSLVMYPKSDAKRCTLFWR